MSPLRTSLEFINPIDAYPHIKFRLISLFNNLATTLHLNHHPLWFLVFKYFALI